MYNWTNTQTEHTGRVKDDLRRMAGNSQSQCKWISQGQYIKHATYFRETLTPTSWVWPIWPMLWLIWGGYFDLDDILSARPLSTCSLYNKCKSVRSTTWWISNSQYFSWRFMFFPQFTWWTVFLWRPQYWLERWHWTRINVSQNPLFATRRESTCWLKLWKPFRTMIQKRTRSV